MEHKSVSEKAIGVVGKIFLVFFVLFFITPILWAIIISFKSDNQIFNTFLKFTPTLENYKAVLTTGNYVKAFLDNLIISGGAVIVSVIVGVPAAYALARYKFKRKRTSRSRSSRSNSPPRSWSSSRCTGSSCPCISTTPTSA